MKILIVNKFLYPKGGSETYIFEVGKQLQKMGCEVQYFGMEHERRIVGNRIESYTSNMDFHSGGLSKLLYPFKIIYSVEARKKIRKVLDDMEPDIVHLNNFNFQLTPSILYEIRKYEKKVGKRIRIIYTAHDYQLICPNHLLFKPTERKVCEKCIGKSGFDCARGKCIHGSLIKSLLGSLEKELYCKLHAYRKIDRIICPSYFMADRLSCEKDLKDRLIVMHNFVGQKEFADVPKERYVLYFGRYSEEKGIHTLLKACQALPDIPFVFVGDGPMGQKVSCVKNVQNKGFMTGQKLYQVIAGAAFAIFPSEWYENCPISVMESQIYGTPVLASSMGGILEVMQEGVSGELFQAGNVEELKEKINKLWLDQELCDRYTKGCRHIQFDSAEDYCRKLLEIYQKTP